MHSITNRDNNNWYSVQMCYHFARPGFSTFLGVTILPLVNRRMAGSRSIQPSRRATYIPRQTDSATSVGNFPTCRSMSPKSATTWRAIKRDASLEVAPFWLSFLIKSSDRHSSGETLKMEWSGAAWAQVSRRPVSPPSMAIWVIFQDPLLCSSPTRSAASASHSLMMSSKASRRFSRSNKNCSYRRRCPRSSNKLTPDFKPRSTAMSN
mmetsp:Transcript_13170/g.37037  ORF Transcript_13170/g.37037 Transcript_13170/m.37037 type:complete len:208 (+) Transcript_13170:2368-2991(+)